MSILAKDPWNAIMKEKSKIDIERDSLFTLIIDREESKKGQQTLLKSQEDRR